jgi:hypothetical protein
VGSTPPAQTPSAANFFFSNPASEVRFAKPGLHHWQVGTMFLPVRCFFLSCCVAAVASASADAKLTMLPPGSQGACLDGSPYGFYYLPAANNASTKWTINIQGGGWCYNESLCSARAQTSLGSSNKFANPKSFDNTIMGGDCRCMNLDSSSSTLDDCHCIYLPYCDGASFSGFREEKWKNLTFRGLANLDDTIGFAIASLGLEKATDLVVSGGSAGGLSTFLHTDRIVSRVRASAPSLQNNAVGTPFVGFFLDHSNFNHGPQNYTAWMKYIVDMQNLTKSDGASGGGSLSSDCVAAFVGEEFKCFMAPHMQKFVKTPWFMFNSKYDAWQVNRFQV